MNAPSPKGGVALLQDMDPPKGWPETRWANFVADAWSFKRLHGKAAVDLGWTPLELFGVSREAPYALHALGAIPLIKGRKVAEITPNEIFVETDRERIDKETGEITMDRLRISKRAVAPDTVLIWELAQKS